VRGRAILEFEFEEGAAGGRTKLLDLLLDGLAGIDGRRDVELRVA